MAVEFKLPELGEGVDSADVAELLVAEGDTVEAEQPLMELETDKAVMELPSPCAGTIAKIHVAPGDALSIGMTLLTIEPGDAATKTSASGQQKKEQPKKEPAKKGKTKAKKEPVAAPTSAATPVATAPNKATNNSGVPTPAGPATRRMARELGVDLHQVAGSGKKGRISPEDVQAYVRNRLSQPATGGGMTLSAPLPDFTQFGPTERQSLNKIARASAANLTTAWQTIPHVTQHDLADITELETARKRYMASREGQRGPKITTTAIAVKACVAALKEFPKFNSSIDIHSGELVLKQYYNIGIAVDTPNGLLVPVIRNADQKTVVEVAAEMTDLATRARDRKLSIDEMQGATFTITNLGGIGGTGFTPIVNPPEVAILGMSRSRVELRPGGRRPAERLMLPLSLSYDHRVVNGADAARFVVKLSNAFADSFTLLIDC